MVEVQVREGAVQIAASVLSEPLRSLLVVDSADALRLVWAILIAIRLPASVTTPAVAVTAPPASVSSPGRTTYATIEAAWASTKATWAAETLASKPGPELAVLLVLTSLVCLAGLLGLVSLLRLLRWKSYGISEYSSV